MHCSPPSGQLSVLQAFTWFTRVVWPSLQGERTISFCHRYVFFFILYFITNAELHLWYSNDTTCYGWVSLLNKTIPYHSALCVVCSPGDRRSQSQDDITKRLTDGAVSQVWTAMVESGSICSVLWKVIIQLLAPLPLNGPVPLQTKAHHGFCASMTWHIDWLDTKSSERCPPLLNLILCLICPDNYKYSHHMQAREAGRLLFIHAIFILYQIVINCEGT